MMWQLALVETGEKKLVEEKPQNLFQFPGDGVVKEIKILSLNQNREQN